MPCLVLPALLLLAQNGEPRTIFRPVDGLEGDAPSAVASTRMAWRYVRTSAIAIAGPIDALATHALIAAKKPDLLDCRDRASPSSVKVVVDVAIDAAGHVTGVGFPGRPALDPRSKTYVTAAIRRWKFPAAAGPSTLQLTFEAADAPFPRE